MENKEGKTDKPFELLRRRYCFDKYTRKLRWEPPKWQHVKSYKTIEAVNDAIYQRRRNDTIYDYPGEELETKYPELKPSIYIHRFKVNSNGK